MDECAAEDMNGEPLSLTTLLGTIKGSEITFTSKGKQMSLTPPLIADIEKEFNKKKSGILFILHITYLKEDIRFNYLFYFVLILISHTNFVRSYKETKECNGFV